jgi:8-oxo-dGTP pyrophosphatase MutT (NUDIX family)
MRASLPPLQVVAAAIVDSGKVLLVSKQEAPDVFYLPGGKPERDEEPRDTLARELEEELGVAIVRAELLGVVSDEAAIEGVAMKMHVYLVRVSRPISTRAEIAALTWVGADGEVPGRLAPAVRNHVLPELAARQLIT